MSLSMMLKSSLRDKSHLYLSIILLPLLAGCVSQNKFTDGSLSEDKGVIAFTIECPGIVTWLSVYKTGRVASELSIYAADLEIHCGKVITGDRDGLKLVDLKSGDYFIGTYGGRAKLHIDEEEAIKFSVVENQVTYIGSFKFSTGFDQDRSLEEIKTVYYALQIDINDNEENDLASIEQLYPGLIDKYKYKKVISERGSSILKNDSAAN